MQVFRGQRWVKDAYRPLILALVRPFLRQKSLVPAGFAPVGRKIGASLWLTSCCHLRNQFSTCYPPVIKWELDNPDNPSMCPYLASGAVPTGYWRAVTNIPNALCSRMFCGRIGRGTWSGYLPTTSGIAGQASSSSFEVGGQKG